MKIILSFSDEDCSSLFITQSSFREINTQDAFVAADYLDTLGNVSSGDSPKLDNDGLTDWCEHKDVQYFDFTGGEVDNGYDVCTQNEGFVLKSHEDGSVFFVGNCDNTSTGDITKSDIGNSTIVDGIPPMYDSALIGDDLKCFGNAVSEEKLDENKFKRYV